MNDRRTWGFSRWIYVGAAVIAAIAAVLGFANPSGLSINPWLAAVIALLVLSVPLFASDAMLDRVHRIFWRREWPK